MSEDRAEKEGSENSQCEEEEEVSVNFTNFQSLIIFFVNLKEIEESLSEGQKLLNYMEDVYERIMQSCTADDKVMIVSKNGNLIKSSTNMAHEKALENSGCVLNFFAKAKTTLQKIFPDEPIEFIRIKGRKNNEILHFNDEQLEIVIIQNSVGF